MIPAIPAWPARLVRLGRLRTMLALSGFAVVASVLLVAVFTVIFDAPRAVWPKYYIPAVVVPLCVAPIVIRLLLDLAFALDAAHRQAATQQRELERVHQLDVVGRLASGLAHELNNVLTVVRASVEALGGATANGDLAAIDEAAQRGARITKRLLAISRHDEIVRRVQPLRPVLDDIQRVLPRLLSPSTRLVLPTEIPDLHLELDADAVQHALLNLVLNARDALEQPGRITITVTREQTDATPWLVLAVKDDGRGMPEAFLARATEPFVTTRAAHEGTGLGLTVVRRTMELHGGRLALASTPGRGTTAALWFPIPPQPDVTNGSASAAADAAANAAAETERPATPAVSDRHRRVLLVDDEAQVREVTTRVLERAGFNVDALADVPAAQEWLRVQPPVDVIVTDVMMPGTTGLDFLQQLRASGEHTPVLLVSGFSVERVEEIAAADRAVRFLAKPWSPELLVTAVAELAGARPAAPAAAPQVS